MTITETKVTTYISLVETDDSPLRLRDLIRKKEIGVSYQSLIWIEFVGDNGEKYTKEIFPIIGRLIIDQGHTLMLTPFSMFSSQKKGKKYITHPMSCVPGIS